MFSSVSLCHVVVFSQLSAPVECQDQEVLHPPHPLFPQQRDRGGNDLRRTGRTDGEREGRDCITPPSGNERDSSLCPDGEDDGRMEEEVGECGGQRNDMEAGGGAEVCEHKTLTENSYLHTGVNMPNPPDRGTDTHLRSGGTSEPKKLRVCSSAKELTLCGASAVSHQLMTTRPPSPHTTNTGGSRKESREEQWKRYKMDKARKERTESSRGPEEGEEGDSAGTADRKCGRNGGMEEGGRRRDRCRDGWRRQGREEEEQC